jgi:exodeoxyribonuclease VII small subunit
MEERKPPSELRYEEAFEELKELVEELESGEMPLEQALAQFERGRALADRCHELLESAELRLRQLVPEESGGYQETDLDLEDL